MDVTTRSRLSDDELVAEVSRLARGERRATATLIARLAELYARRLHERAGFSSLFTYCTEVLHLSDHEAYDRMKAAKVERRYPAVLLLLATGRVNLTTIRLLAPHLTPENHRELFAAAAGLRKRGVQELLARRFPQPDVASSVRKLPTPRILAAPTVALPVAAPGAAAPPPTRPIATHGESAAIPAPPRPLVRPLAADRYHISFTASAQACEELEFARDLLRHAIPSGDAGLIVERALVLLVQDLVREKFALTDRPLPARGQADDSRNIPAEVKRAVFLRDRGGCAFVGTGGRRCAERAFVEFHHRKPHAAGGRPTVDNIELRCRSHNAYEAELFFGPVRSYGGAGVVKEAAVPYGRVTKDTFSFRNEKHRNSGDAVGSYRV